MLQDKADFIFYIVGTVFLCIYILSHEKENCLNPTKKKIYSVYVNKKKDRRNKIFEVCCKISTPLNNTGNVRVTFKRVGIIIFATEKEISIACAECLLP